MVEAAVDRPVTIILVPVDRLIVNGTTREFEFVPTLYTATSVPVLLAVGLAKTCI